jgi:hypothetical protein
LHNQLVWVYEEHCGGLCNLAVQKQ